jgi:hypothetical protein
MSSGRGVSVPFSTTGTPERRSIATASGVCVVSCRISPATRWPRKARIAASSASAP